MKKVVAIVFLCAGCIEPYAPPASMENINALVVDGYVDADGSASVVLSRTTPLDGSSLSPKETGAEVTIESSGGETFQLHENDSATYTAIGLVVDKASTYTLHIVTANGSDYRSDAMQIHSTPPVDSVYHTISPTDLLEIRVDSHITDPNSTSFYHIYGIETYEYHSPLNAHYKLVNQKAVERLPGEDVSICYIDKRTGNTIVTTKDLSENRLSGIVVSRIERTSPKIATRYSILVKQRTISQEEYAFQQMLITTTEQQGGIFAPIPGAVAGNIHSSDPDEYVLGYFRAQEVKELRYSIDAYHNPLPVGFYQAVASTCQSQSTCYLPGTPQRLEGLAYPDCVDVTALSEGAGIVEVVTDASGTPLRYVFGTAECTDCKYQGGTTTRPPFW